MTKICCLRCLFLCANWHKRFFFFTGTSSHSFFSRRLYIHTVLTTPLSLFVVPHLVVLRVISSPPLHLFNMPCCVCVFYFSHVLLCTATTEIKVLPTGTASLGTPVCLRPTRPTSPTPTRPSLRRRCPSGTPAGSTTSQARARPTAQHRQHTALFQWWCVVCALCCACVRCVVRSVLFSKKCVSVSSSSSCSMDRFPFQALLRLP